jgi:hypothetical protein
MNSNISTLHSNKNFCYAVDCKNEATIEMKLNVGKFGLITISLCKNCLPKFRGKKGL